jgi:ADP-ribosylglycohydrolase
MLGAIIGDIVGSIYEFHNHRSRDFPLFGPNTDYTDDIVCTIAVADALLSGRDPALALRDWCGRYPGRGYGGMFAAWLSNPRAGPYGSFGNGSAMRVSPAGLLAATEDEALRLADRVTVVTHNHPEGIKGARATVAAIRLAREGITPAAIRRELARRFGYDLSRSVDDIRPVYAFNETCQQTVPQALTCALEAPAFEDAIRNAISIGGDSDTVGAIAGAVAEACFGIPDAVAATALGYLPAEMVEVLTRLYAAAGAPGIGLRSPA